MGLIDKWWLRDEFENLAEIGTSESGDWEVFEVWKLVSSFDKLADKLQITAQFSINGRVAYSRYVWPVMYVTWKTTWHKVNYEVILSGLNSEFSIF